MAYPDLLAPNPRSVMQTTRERFHDATGTYALQTVSVQPKARVSSSTTYYDPLGRTVAHAFYGTNGAVPLQPSLVPPPASDTVLVSLSQFNAMKREAITLNARGIATLNEWDVAGRPVRMIENFAPGDSTTGANRTTEWVYDSWGRLEQMIAKNPATGDQHTRFAYGTTLVESSIARNDLVRAMIYPDSDDTILPLGNGADGVYDRVEFTYTRQAQVRTKQDQLGTVHTIEYDGLGRWIHDRATTLGLNVFGGARQISRTFTGTGRVDSMYA